MYKRRERFVGETLSYPRMFTARSWEVSLRYLEHFWRPEKASSTCISLRSGGILAVHVAWLCRTRLTACLNSVNGNTNRIYSLSRKVEWVGAVHGLTSLNAIIWSGSTKCSTPYLISPSWSKILFLLVLYFKLTFAFVHILNKTDLDNGTSLCFELAERWLGWLLSMASSTREPAVLQMLRPTVFA